MILLKELKEQVKSIGPIRRAWFTTFNLNLDLLENFILPVIAGTDQPVNSMAFETMHQKIYDEEYPIDIKVFYDIRTQEHERVKKTSIPIFGIDFRRNLLFKKEESFRNGFFHPKVIYLEGEKGEVIGAGSANLTIAAWGKQRECFHFERLKGEQNRKEVRDFFKRIHVWCGLKDDFDLPVPKGENNPSSWSFISSISDWDMVATLCDKADQLTVWSPYLSRNLVSLSNEIRKFNHDIEIAIVPDQYPSERIRAEAHTIANFLESHPKNSLFTDESINFATRFSHAKVWLTPNHMAIGSWNFTHAALGFDKSKRNVEAGFVFFKGGGRRPSHLKQISKTNDLKKIVLSKEEMDLETRELDNLQPPKIPITVKFDWMSRQWIWDMPLDGPWVKLNPRLRLLASSKDFIWIDLVKRPQGEETLNDSDFFLKQRTVALEYTDNGVTLTFPVWLIELNPVFKPIARFDAFDDLLNALIAGKPETATNGLSFLGTESEKQLEYEDKEVQSELEQNGHPSYFKLFAATNRVKRIILTSEDSISLLKRIQVLPGCVAEVVSMGIRMLEEHPEWSSVYRWFLIQEIRSLIQISQKQWKRIANGEKCPFDFAKALRHKSIAQLPDIQEGQADLQTYVDYVCQEGGYK